MYFGCIAGVYYRWVKQKIISPEGINIVPKIIIITKTTTTILPLLLLFPFIHIKEIN